MPKNIRNIAEKVHAMARLGILNSRMKDFYDIWLLSRSFNFKGETLAEAIMKTFENRDTPIPVASTVFGFSISNDRDKKVQWQGFVGKAKLDTLITAFRGGGAPYHLLTAVHCQAFWS